jgi:hypothetical protein
LSHPQLSLQDFFHGKNRCKEVLRDYSGTGKWILFEKCLSLWNQGQPWSSGPWKVSAGEIAVSELLEQDFDVGPGVCIVIECARQFLVDLS